MTENLPIIAEARQLVVKPGPSNSLIGRGLTSIQCGVYRLTVEDRDAHYRKSRDAYNRITVDGASSRWGVIWTPDELIELRSAFQVFQRLADVGYGNAYFPLFTLFDGGLGMPENKDRARYFAKMAFDWCFAGLLQNDPEIWTDLGTLYRLGNGATRIVYRDRSCYDSSPHYRVGGAAEADYVQALFWYRQAAEAGCAAAMFNLWGMYETGEGVDEDLDEALSWQIKAAEAGHSHAQYCLGIQYEHGYRQIDQNDGVAHYYYLQAAVRGHREAISSVARMSRDGFGLPSNDDLAFDWCQKQAEQGHIWAQWFLGEAYRNGCGIEHDDEKAAYWYRQAAQQGEPKAQYELGHLLLPVFENADEAWQWIKAASDQGFGPAQRLRAVHQEDLAEDARENLIDQAVAWYLERVEGGDAERQYEYALMHLKDEIPKASRSEGLYWLRKSAEQNYRQACETLGSHLLKDSAGDEMTQEAILWLDHAAELGSASACKELGDLYLLGHAGRIHEKQSRPQLVQPNSTIAVEWYECGISLGWRDIAYLLGRLYIDGEHLVQDAGLAEKWLLHAANAGHGSAQLVLGKEYASGLRLNRHAGLAIHWLTKASESATSTGLILGKIYLEGDLVARDFKKAIQWLTHAAESNTFRVDAMKIIEAFRVDGRLSASEETEAQEWLANQAALAVDAIQDANFHIAVHNMCSLAEIYELGLGVEPDQQQAIRYYTDAAENGLAKAKARLHELGIDWENP